MALRSYSVLDILLPSIIIICKTTHMHWIHINVCRVSCGGMINMLLVLSITFYFHYNIWGCMYSTGPFQYRWLKGYVYSSCYHHHQIGSIHLSHCYPIFPRLCAWDVCYIIFCHLLHIRSGKTGNLFSLVCDLNRTPNCYGKTWRFLCPFFRNLHLRENLARDCFTSTVSTVTNSGCAKYLYPSMLLWQINCCNL